MDTIFLFHDQTAGMLFISCFENIWIDLFTHRLFPSFSLY